MVTAQQITPQAVPHKGLRRLEHLWLRPTEAVDALLRVAHQENARPWSCGTGIGAEPTSQRLPLQGVGVLELINQQVFDAGIKPLLHPARQHRIPQHDQCRALDIVHVHPTAFPLEARKITNQPPRQAGHALLVKPGRMLLARLDPAQHQGLGVPNLLDTQQFVAELACLAFIGQQCRDDPIDIVSGQGGPQCNALLRKRPGCRTAQGRSSLLDRLPLRQALAQQVFRLSQACVVGVLGGEMTHRSRGHAVCISQAKLSPLIQRSL